MYGVNLHKALCGVQVGFEQHGAFVTSHLVLCERSYGIVGCDRVQVKFCCRSPIFVGIRVGSSQPSSGNILCSHRLCAASKDVLLGFWLW